MTDRPGLQKTGLTRVVVAGGVGANVKLRSRLKELADSLEGECFYPRSEFCTDNAAMIALVGALRLAAGERSEGLDAGVQPRWPLDKLRPPATT